MNEKFSLMNIKMSIFYNFFESMNKATVMSNIHSLLLMRIHIHDEGMKDFVTAKKKNAGMYYSVN